MLHLVICDDEPSQLALLEAYVRQWAGEKKTDIKISQCRNAQQFLFLWEEERAVDIALLDIDMPGMNGICLAHKLRGEGERLPIIFVTGLTDYVLEGYDVEAVSYLLKPVRKDKLFACLDKAADRRRKEEPSLLLEMPGGTARLGLKEICYVESTAHDTLVYRACGGEGLRCRTGIRQLEESLCVAGGSFFKIHRSYLVNLSWASRITRKEVVMDTGQALPIARGRWEAVNQAYLDYYRGKRGE